MESFFKKLLLNLVMYVR